MIIDGYGAAQAWMGMLARTVPVPAMQTPAGRERLEVLLLDFASHEEIPGALRIDVAALRRELGI